MYTDPYQQEIAACLADRGHTPEEIEKIMARLGQYDARVVRDALFDSMETGDFDIDAIIEEALAEDET
jgi:hypothetical protein